MSCARRDGDIPQKRRKGVSDVLAISVCDKILDLDDGNGTGTGKKFVSLHLQYTGV